MVEMPLEEARPLLRQFPTLVPSGVSFMKKSGLITEGAPEEFEALAGRCAVFRFDPDYRVTRERQPVRPLGVAARQRASPS